MTGPRDCGQAPAPNCSLVVAGESSQALLLLETVEGEAHNISVLGSGPGSCSTASSWAFSCPSAGRGRQGANEMTRVRKNRISRRVKGYALRTVCLST